MRTRDSRYEQVDPQRIVEFRDASEFDRIAFAMRSLDRLRPKITVAVYPAASTLRIEQGRDLKPSGEAAWAIVGIPPHASREQIAYALAELVGMASVPYAVQMLLADDGSAAG